MTLDLRMVLCVVGLGKSYSMVAREVVRRRSITESQEKHHRCLNSLFGGYGKKL